MRKKGLILLSAFFIGLILFSGVAFANTSDDIKHGISEAGNTVVDGAERLWDDVRSGINNAGSSIINGAEHLGSDIRNGVGNAENGIEGALSTDNFGGDDDKGTTDYVATRTTGDGAGTSGIDTTTATTWVWVIVAIAAVVIVGLVWYYAVQNTNHGKHDDE